VACAIAPLVPSPSGLAPQVAVDAGGLPIGALSPPGSWAARHAPSAELSMPLSEDLASGLSVRAVVVAQPTEAHVDPDRGETVGPIAADKDVLLPAFIDPAPNFAP